MLTFWVYSEVRMVAFVDKEWGYPSSSARGIVVRELS